MTAHEIAVAIAIGLFVIGTCIALFATSRVYDKYIGHTFARWIGIANFTGAILFFAGLTAGGGTLSWTNSEWGFGIGLIMSLLGSIVSGLVSFGISFDSRSKPEPIHIPTRVRVLQR